MSPVYGRFESVVMAVFIALAAAFGVGTLSSCGYDGPAPGNVLDAGGTVPSVSSLTPTTAVVGSTITVFGADFQDGDMAVFTGEAAGQSVSSLTPTSFQVVVPEDAYSGTVRVQRGYALSAPVAFAIVPVISSVFIPPAGSGGTATVYGSGFNQLQPDSNEIWVGDVGQFGSSVTLLPGLNRLQASIPAGALSPGVQSVYVTVTAQIIGIIAFGTYSNSVTTSVAP